MAADIRWLRWLDDVTKPFVIANDQMLIADQSVQPAYGDLIEGVFPLAFRLELLRGSKTTRDNHRWFLGDGDDAEDIAKINEMMVRLGQTRSREKFRTTIRLVSLAADREALLLVADFLADAMRYAQAIMFEKGVDYRQLDAKRARDLISGASYGEHRGMIAAAMLFRKERNDATAKRTADRKKKEEAKRQKAQAKPAATEGLQAAAFSSGEPGTTLRNGAIYAQFEREYPDLDGSVIIHAKFDKGLLVEPLRPMRTV